MIVKNKSIVWVGAIDGKNELYSNPAVSPAANRWQNGILNGLKGQGHIVHLIAHQPTRSWPIGSIFIKGFRRDQGKWVGYINIPLLKNISLAFNYIQALAELRLSDAILLTYNASWENLQAGRWWRSIGRKWVCFVADVPSKRLFLQAERHASGVVYLSWFGFCNSRANDRFHLDGGVETIQQKAIMSENTSIFTFGYMGTLGAYGGIMQLVAAFSSVTDQNLRLIITGHGVTDELKCAVARDSRITLFGLVNEETLSTLCVAVDAFINPRPAFLEENRYNFPSKVLDYLAWCKPVISTWTDGLAPEYREILELPSEIDGLAETIRRVASWDQAKKVEVGSRIATWLTEKRLWSVQARRLHTWLSPS